MTIYATDHAEALADIIDAGGQLVSFTERAGTLSETTGQDSSVSASTIAAYAIRVQSEGRTTEPQGSKETDLPTLIIVPVTIGEEPKPGHKVTWASTVYTVGRVQPVAPDGTTIAARVELKR